MRSIVLSFAAAAMLTGGIGLAQPAFAQSGPGVTPGTAAGTNPANVPGNNPANNPANITGRMPGNTPGNNPGNTAAASGNDNQAVATTNANAPSPAHGANSFTVGQARTRIEKGGFSHVSDLRKDNNGIWHAQAQKDGNTTTVWLDYKGNVGVGH